ncbi:unnamed protein product (macronuclear) [Paramecium tetraurelia]|uniref:TNFR-Cys domain-containing protein n=1 Tax=Paramecium tetraurelia TaxID=5888 RepID=A0CI58_PARTE|nr:uncharacterized protein GSPATT00038579001 [Paramecium tetraurelia]CAK70475.1 unnamed protein product [Paramecium tetraurelia]|eukprot:XP_001437872.1 hypothetical protein (macronuclear) [Paramecium tetraurelia strain d4-2]
MIQSSFAIILYLNCLIKVFGIQETISTSFKDSTFSDADNWVVVGAQPQITQCSTKTLFGGYNIFGAKTSITKTIALPPHYQLNMAFLFCNIDISNVYMLIVYFDQNIGYSVQVSPTQANSICGNGAVGDSCSNFRATFSHSSPTAVILVTTTMTQPADQQFWGIRDIIIYVDKCPDGCLLCKATDLTVQCLGWQVFHTSWAQLNINEISSDGWNVNFGIAEATQCGSTALFGGSNKFGVDTDLSQSFFNIPKHDKLRIQFLWTKIESWNQEAASMLVNGAKVWETKFLSSDGYNWQICGEQPDKNLKTCFYRVDVELNQTSQLDITFTTNIYSTTQQQSFGIRDFVIYTRYCPQGTYWTGVSDFICQYCYKSCYKCDGPNQEDCTDCGDPTIYKKQLVAGQCKCISRTIEQDNIDGTTSCQTCNPKCERCYKPFDNTVNQYCTMCLEGLNRVVSDQFMCVCRTGYGEDGISEACFKCHYTCEHCNGFLANNCTTCSSQSNRILTSDNQCICNIGYYDTGINDIICKKICHNTCSSCTLAGVDQCTGCPITRKPDRTGTTFQCLCKNSHQYSDETKLECQECHLTCLTCNGGQDSNCLTCDIAYRKLSMQKCICPNGYYDKGQLICSPCHKKCMTCFGPAENNCLTCSNSNNRVFKTNLCICPDTYMEKQVGDVMCYKCSYRCSSCSVKIENCTACPLQSYRDLGTDNSCSCQANMYDQLNNPICIPCHYTCLTCKGPESNQCSSCYTQIMRQLDPSGSCLCMNSYYDPGKAGCLGINQTILACNPRCLNCAISADNCISCKSDRYLQGNTCICQNKINGALISKYEKSGKVDCLSCHYSCLDCYGSEFNQCTKCLDSEGRILSNSTCLCASPNIDIGKPQCQCLILEINTRMPIQL